MHRSPLRRILLCVVVGAPTTLASQSTFARDPCPLPDALAREAAWSARYSALAERARTLDAVTKAFNAKCDVANPAGSAAERACVSDSIDVTRDLDGHAHAVDAYNRAALAELDARIRVVGERMTTTAAKMSAANTSSVDWQAATKAWIDMGAKARREAQISAVLEALSLVSEAVALDAKQSGELARNSIPRFEAWYTSFGQQLPAAERANVLRRIQRLSSRQQAAELLTLMTHIESAALSPQNAMEDDRYWEAAGHMAVETGKLAQTVMHTDPTLVVIVAATEISLDAAYGWTAAILSKHRAEQLIGLQADNLRAINSLSRLYTDDVNRRKPLDSARAALVGAACFAT